MEPLAHPPQRMAPRAVAASRTRTAPSIGLRRRASPWSSLLLTAFLAGCAGQPPPAPSVSWPYIVPTAAAKQEMSRWTEQQVRACFGEPLDSDVVAGVPRYRFQRGACTEFVMFKDGKVHSVEGYGAEQECWWVVDACAGPSASHPAAPVTLAESWRSWTMEEVVACFGAPREDVPAGQSRALRVERDGCAIDMDLEATHRLFMHEWTETEPGACRRLLQGCDGILRTMQQ